MGDLNGGDEMMGLQGNIAGNTNLPLPYFGTEDIEIKEEISGYNDKERLC